MNQGKKTPQNTLLNLGHANYKMPYEIEKEGAILRLTESLQGIVEYRRFSHQTFGDMGPLTKTLESLKASFDGPNK